MTATTTSRTHRVRTADLERGDVITNTFRHLVIEAVDNETVADVERTTVTYRYVGDDGRVVREVWRTHASTTVIAYRDYGLHTDVILDALVGMPLDSIAS